MPSLHLEIRGRVQGVGFRWFVRETAQALKLRGWVANRRDGSVEVAAAGDNGALEQLRAAVGRGPRGAFVEELRELEPIDDADLTSPFGIVHGR